MQGNPHQLSGRIEGLIKEVVSHKFGTRIIFIQLFVGQVRWPHSGTQKLLQVAQGMHTGTFVLPGLEYLLDLYLYSALVDWIQEQWFPVPVQLTELSLEVVSIRQENLFFDPIRGVGIRYLTITTCTYQWTCV